MANAQVLPRFRWIHRIGLTLCAGLAPLAGAQAPPPAPQPAAAQTLAIQGFEGMFFITSVLSGAFASHARGVVPDVQVRGESMALKALTDGSVHIAMLGRDLLPEEEAAFRAKWGYAPTRVAIAMDALVVLVNRNNPIREIKIEQLDAAYSLDRHQGWAKDVVTWGDLGVRQQGWEFRPIERLGRPADSGNHWLLNESLTLHGRPRLPIRGNLDTSTLTEELAASQAAIAYGNMVEKFASTRIVPLVPKGSTTAVVADEGTVSSGQYPLCRFLYTYINKDPRTGMAPQVQGFLTFALSPAGQGIIRQCGQVPLQPDVLALNLLKVTGRFDVDASKLR